MSRDEGGDALDARVILQTGEVAAASGNSNSYLIVKQPNFAFEEGARHRPYSLTGAGYAGITIHAPQCEGSGAPGNAEVCETS